jgi:hypothetical protein
MVWKIEKIGSNIRIRPFANWNGAARRVVNFPHCWSPKAEWFRAGFVSKREWGRIHERALVHVNCCQNVSGSNRLHVNNPGKSRIGTHHVGRYNPGRQTAAPGHAERRRPIPVSAPTSKMAFAQGGKLYPRVAKYT